MNRVPSGVRARQGRTYVELEAVASNVRSKLMYPSDQPIVGLKFFDEINSIKIELDDGSVLPLQTGIEPLGDGREGLSRYNPDTCGLEILLAPETYDGLESGIPRATYCLVHEFAHALLHHDELRQLAQLPQPSQIAFHRGTQKLHPVYFDTEWQANALAAALLMPARGLRDLEQRHRLLTEALVMRQYGVSAKAAEIRISVFTERKAALLTD